MTPITSPETLCVYAGDQAKNNNSKRFVVRSITALKSLQSTKLLLLYIPNKRPRYYLSNKTTGAFVFPLSITSLIKRLGRLFLFKDDSGGVKFEAFFEIQVSDERLLCSQQILPTFRNKTLKLTNGLQQYLNNSTSEGNPCFENLHKILYYKKIPPGHRV